MGEWKWWTPNCPVEIFPLYAEERSPLIICSKLGFSDSVGGLKNMEAWAG